MTREIGSKMGMKLRAAMATVVMGLSGIGVAHADPVVVELYTSQGCSSCPPADALLTTLAEREDVIALALHVDYWDYIGWADTFADAGFTKRQRAYARSAGKRMIYTPQMVIGGLDHVVGNKPAEVEEAISKHASLDHGVNVTLVRQGGQVAISLDAETPGDMVVQLVRFRAMETVAIGRGENAGRTIDYANIVTGWEQLRNWNGRAPLSLQADASGGGNFAVVVQDRGAGIIRAAASLR